MLSMLSDFNASLSQIYSIHLSQKLLKNSEIRENLSFEN